MKPLKDYILGNKDNIIMKCLMDKIVDCSDYPEKCSFKDDWNYCLSRIGKVVKICIYVDNEKNIKKLKAFLSDLDNYYDMNQDRYVPAYDKIIDTCNNTIISPYQVIPDVLEIDIIGRKIDYISFHNNRATERVVLRSSSVKDIRCYYKLTSYELYNYVGIK